MTIRDRVELDEGTPDVALFRWHLGTNDDVTIRGTGNKWKASWSDAAMAIAGSSAFLISQVKLPDDTVNAVSDDNIPDLLHTCLVVQTPSPLTAVNLVTVVKGTK
jgi:hypothetical protein